MAAPRPHTRLYLQVLAGIALGVLVGLLWPETGAAGGPLRHTPPAKVSVFQAYLGQPSR